MLFDPDMFETCNSVFTILETLATTLNNHNPSIISSTLQIMVVWPPQFH